MKKHLRIALLGAALIAGPLALPSSAAPTPADAGPTPVVSDLAGPLHLSYRASDDSLYIADAFAGLVWKADPTTGDKAPAPGGAFAPGTFVTGVDNASNGGFYATITLPGPQDEQNPTQLVKVGPNGGQRVVADLLAYELENNPDGEPQQGDTLSNPYDVLAVPGGGAYVADAAGNDILFVADSGKVRTLTVLPVSRRGDCADVENNGVPNGGCDAVPTDMMIGPDGFLYVAGLGGEVEGIVWKIDRSTGQIVQAWRKLPPLTGVAVDEDGNIYASSLFVGAILRITPDGERTAVEVPGPTGLALHDGKLYTGSLDFGGGPGSVLRIGVHLF